MMNTDELLQAINVMLDEKLRETEHNLKDYIDQRLHDSENMILNEVDRVQEKPMKSSIIYSFRQYNKCR